MSGRVLRCAIYTRKSTEEGLDRAFNSLEAQRESCAAYVASQKDEGWILVDSHYDDGGYSGGSMERPALKTLLADVERGKVDVVVVYKVDRLTRSLTDFAKIVHVLDVASASFVSITQAFNTTSSMGRLTLNVLLSFAQFEREVIAERVRDKIAASKARGMWMGGGVPLGYDARDGKLIVVPEEAEIVREIMRRYLASCSIRELLEDLRQGGITSKMRRSKDGTAMGGTTFKRGALYYLLANRLYVGEITHKGTAYRGQHEPVVDRELFDAVQRRLAERTNPRSSLFSRKVVSLLAGLVRDDLGRPMPPVHTQRHGKRYRYYATHVANIEGDRARRISAAELEQAVRKNLAEILDHGSLFGSGLEAADQALRVGPLRSALAQASNVELAPQLKGLGLQITVGLREVHLTLNPCVAAGLSQGEEATVRKLISFGRRRHGYEERKQTAPEGITGDRDEALLALIARAFEARCKLLEMDECVLRSLPATRIRHLERIARLSFLEPLIIRSIQRGTQPPHITARYLSRMGNLPISWKEQRQVLGFNFSKDF